jgi:MYXO-CTERM domain-containing protein
MNCRTISVIPAALLLTAFCTISSSAQTTTNQQNANRGANTTSVPATNDPAQNTAVPNASTSSGNSPTTGADNANPGYGASSESNEPSRNHWGWIGLLGLGGLFGLGGRREPVHGRRNREVTQDV